MDVIADDEIIYLCGPMTGRPNFNYVAFIRAAAQLRERGYKVMNPTETFGGDQTLGYTTYIRKNISDMLNVHHIVTLEGWLGSPGARLEVAMGVALGLPVWHFDPPKDEKDFQLVPYSHYNELSPHQALNELFKIL